LWPPIIQWIMDNGINLLKESMISRSTSPKLFFHT
jgi:hypothetical protein